MQRNNWFIWLSSVLCRLNISVVKIYLSPKFVSVNGLNVFKDTVFLSHSIKIKHTVKYQIEDCFFWDMHLLFIEFVKMKIRLDEDRLYSIVLYCRSAGSQCTIRDFTVNVLVDYVTVYNLYLIFLKILYTGDIFPFHNVLILYLLS